VRGGGRRISPLLAGLSAAIVVVGLLLIVILAHPFGGTGTSFPVAEASASGSSNATLTAEPAGTPATSGAASSPVTAVGTPLPTSGPTSTASTPGPTPVGEIAIRGTWSSPAAGATFDTWTLNLAARPILTAPSTVVSEVTFNVAWKNGRTTACRAEHAGSTGAWACTADLVQLDVPPGPLALSFDIADASGIVTQGAGDDLGVTYEAVPPKPADPKLTTVSDSPSTGGNSSTLVERVTWSLPAGYATKVRLYAVLFCPNDAPKAKDGTPCLTEHTSLPASKLKLVAEADGDANSLTIRHTVKAGLCGPTLWCSGDVYALVLAAYNEYGHSVFTIVTSTNICHSCTF